jgi:hypothetical protein
VLLPLRVISLRPFVHQVLVIGHLVLTRASQQIVGACRPLILFPVHLGLLLGLQINENSVLLLDVLQLPVEKYVWPSSWVSLQLRPLDLLGTSRLTAKKLLRASRALEGVIPRVEEGWLLRVGLGEV